MSVLIEIKNVTKQYANHKALDNICISIQQGSIFGLLGPNGAGKTSLIRILNQITAPDEGEILIHNRLLHPNDTAIIGYLPEERGLYKKMKVGEQCLYLAQLKGLSKEDALKKLKYWFEKFEIQAWWYKRIEELSKGMQQKIQFITTILHEPTLLIFDEPFTGFDPINVNLLKQEMLTLRDKGATLILSTHNMESVETLCDHICLIHHAEKILDGQVNDIKQQYKQNIFQVTLQNLTKSITSLLPENFIILNEEQQNKNIQIKIKTPAECRANELLSLLLPHATILSYNEILPSMNEIFITTVNNKTNELKHG